LSDVFDSDRDRLDNDASSEPEPEQSESEPGKSESQSQDEITDEASAPDEANPETTDDKSHHVPVSVLQKEREKFKSREEALRSEVDQRFAQYQNQIGQLHAQIAAAQQHQQQMQQQLDPELEPIDPLDDLPGYLAQLESNFEQKLQSQQQSFQRERLNDHMHMSERMARQTHGNEAVDEAMHVLQQVPQYAAQFAQQPDPYGALIRWHSQIQAMQRIGGDVGAYEERIRKEAREKVLEELKTGGGQSESQPVSVPGSLMGATQAGSQGAAISDEDLLNGIFDTDRDRRA